MSCGEWFYLNRNRMLDRSFVGPLEPDVTSHFGCIGGCACRLAAVELLNIVPQYLLSLDENGLAPIATMSRARLSRRYIV